MATHEDAGGGDLPQITYQPSSSIKPFSEDQTTQLSTVWTKDDATETVVRDVYALFGQVRSGNSGGPLFATDGSVYGVVFASAIDDPNTGYALTDAQVAKAVTAGRTATAPPIPSSPAAASSAFGSPRSRST